MALAAGEFVRVALGRRGVEPDLFECGLDQPPALCLARREAVRLEAFLDDLGHREPRRQAIGVGETADDLRPFEARAYARSLVGVDA